MVALQRIVDGHGVDLTVLGMVSVYFSLAILWFAMASLGRWFTRSKAPSTPMPESVCPPLPAEDRPDPAVIAVISAALALDLAGDDGPAAPPQPLNAWQLSGRRSPPNPLR